MRRFSNESGGWRTWLAPFSALLAAALVIFGFSVFLDAGTPSLWLERMLLVLRPNPEAAASAISNAGEVVAAVLAIAITVVAIIVELAATRYTHRITELFISEWRNFAVMGFFVVTALQCLWVALTFDDAASGTGHIPEVSFQFATVMLACCLLLLLPYFAFVFKFLNPIQIVDRIRKHTSRAIDPARRRRLRENEAQQAEAIRGIEQLTDVALNAMENKDKGVCLACVDSLGALVTDYESFRAEMSDSWFGLTPVLRQDSDFVSMNPEALAELERRRIWFEMKVLRQYQTIYNEALNRMRDVNYRIAIDTRRVAETAAQDGHWELVALAIKFFNTYLRATINARDVRTAYNILQQYRLLGESLLSYERGTHTIEIVRHFQYYGLTAFHANLPFLLETVAYDLCTLLESAFDRESPTLDALLRIFLEVDKESEGEVQENSLRGVRKAQIKLATHFLEHDREDLARRVFADMENERTERLASIRDELLGVKSPEFWEISDRGVNFDYLSPNRKLKLLEYFEWYGERLAPPRESRLPYTRSILPPAVPIPTDIDLHDAPPLGNNPFEADDFAQSDQ